MPHSHLRVVLAAALTANLPANAAEWVAEPTVNLRQNYDDNIRLTSAEHDGVWSTSLDPRLELSRRSEIWDITGSARLRSQKYYGEDDLNTNDTFLTAAISRQFERGAMSASASLVNDTTLQNETLDLDTGITVNQIDRTQRGLGLTGSYMLTEATWIEGSISQGTVEYDQGEQYGLLDYDTLTPSLTAIHQLDPQLRLFGTLSQSVVEYDNFSSLESTTDSLQFGSTYEISEVWKVTGSVGSRRTNTSQSVPTRVARPGFEDQFFDGLGIYNIAYIPRDSESTGLVFNAELTRDFETGSLLLSANRSVTPSSTGTDTESTRFGITGKKNFNTKLSAQLAVSYYQSSTVGDVTTTADNSRSRVSPSLSWRIYEDLALSAGYNYTRVKREAANNESVDSNAVFANIGYTWPRIAVSR